MTSSHSIETYECLHSYFDSFLITYALTIIVRHQRFSLVPSMLISHYWQHVSIALQRVQAIMILQWVVTFGLGSSLLPHIIVSAPLSLANLWQTTTFSSQVFFVIIDCHFVALGPICIGVFSLFFIDHLLSYFLWVVSTHALICLVLLMDGVPDFDIQGFSSFW